MDDSRPERPALSNHLIRRASKLFRSAMENYSRANESYSRSAVETFYLHGGTALELMCKACLASIHPALIADPKHFQSLFVLCETQVDELPPPVMRTITVTEALDRCQRAVPKLSGLAEGLSGIIRYRNDAAHLGLAEFSFLDKPQPMSVDLLALARALDVMLQQLGERGESFYGPFSDAIAAQLREAASEAEVTGRAAIAAAQIEFSRRYRGSLPGYNLVEALYDSAFEEEYETQWHECPACHLDAKVQGYVSPEWETEQAETGEAKRTKLEVTFYPYEMYCRACGLELRGDQLNVADMADSWKLENVNPDDFQDIEDES